MRFSLSKSSFADDRVSDTRNDDCQIRILSGLFLKAY